MGFQTQVNRFQAPGVEGDFASANMRTSALTVPGGLVAGAQGVTIGRFAWIAEDRVTVNNFADGAGGPDGFVHRDQQGLITDYLAEASMLIPAGWPVTLLNEGDFFIKNRGTGENNINDIVYADYADGTGYFGSAPVGASATGSIGATFTATGTGENLAVTAVTGYISTGDEIAGTGVPAGTTITGQTAGTAGGAGTYTTSGATTVAAGTVTAFGNVLVVSAVGTGTLHPGDPITGTNVPAGITILNQTVGAPGGPGQYILSDDATQYVASTALTVVGGVQTNFEAKTLGAVGELVKISSWGN